MTTKYEFTYIIQGSKIAMQIIDYSNMMPRYYSCVKRTQTNKDLIKELNSNTPKIEYTSVNKNIIDILINKKYHVVLDINTVDTNSTPKQYENSSYAIKYILQDYSSLYVQSIHKISLKCYETYIYLPDDDRDITLDYLNNFPRISEDEDRILINMGKSDIVLRPLKHNTSSAKSLKKWYEHTIKEDIPEDTSVDIMDIAFDYNS